MSVATMRFKTLLQREWMQHRWGWLLVMFAPLVITLVTLPFGGVQLGPNEGVNAEISAVMLGKASKLMALVWGISTMAVLSLSLLAMSFQVSGLARRDVQDRSLEFWMSLPGSHSEHLGATLLAHCLLVPLAALFAGAVSGLVIAAGVTVKVLGFAGLAEVQWGSVVQLLLPGLVRLVAGLPLFLLWLLPALLVLMVASAWLKRWGVAAVALAGVLLANLPATRGPVRDWLDGHAQGASQAFFFGNPSQVREAAGSVRVDQMDLPQIWHLVGTDLVTQLGNLASVQFLSGAVIAAACFALLIYKRKHMT
ncbi:hypothetical protein [Inhella sp.]|uniref:hypothetical protein n=1 Tax=Inhella sp. TaxID=1921806 RepID=UPI0035B2096D